MTQWDKMQMAAGDVRKLSMVRSTSSGIPEGVILECAVAQSIVALATVKKKSLEETLDEELAAIRRHAVMIYASQEETPENIAAMKHAVIGSTIAREDGV